MYDVLIGGGGGGRVCDVLIGEEGGGRVYGVLIGEEGGGRVHDVLIALSLKSFVSNILELLLELLLTGLTSNPHFKTKCTAVSPMSSFCSHLPNIIIQND